MHKQTATYPAFTLVELIISITIFGIIMVSVVSIFLFASQMSARVEINRAMQESIKSVLENIAEGVRTEKIGGAIPIGTNCTSEMIPKQREESYKFCLATGKEYVVGYQNDSDWTPITDIGECSKASSGSPITCRILARDSASDDYYPLTNSFVNFTGVRFTVIPGDIPRVVIHFRVQPAYKKGLATEIIQANTRYIQTTFSERIISTQ